MQEIGESSLQKDGKMLTLVSSSISASAMKILPWLLFFILLTLIFLLPKYPIMTPEEFVVNLKKLIHP